MRIAYLSPTGALGGAELCLLDLLASARAIKPEWRPSVILGGPGPLEAELEKLRVPVEVLPLPSGVARLGDAGLIGRGRLAKLTRLGLGGLRASLGTATYAARLRRKLRDWKPDFVHSNGMKMHILGAWSTPSRVPMTWQIHDYLGPRPAMARLLRASRRPGLTAVAVSRSAAEDAARVLGPSVPVHAIHNRIDVERFRPGAGRGEELDALAKVEPAPEGTIRVGLVATFANWKGHHLFIEAAARIPRDRPARFYIVGGPIYQTGGSQVGFEELRAAADKVGLGDRLVLTGHTDHPEAALAGLDIVVHASTRPEPFGRVIVEGMACGRAVVAMNEGGAAELFEDGRTALACPPNDPAALSAVVDRLILDGELRNSLGKAGRESVLARFDRTRLAEAWIPIYESGGTEHKGLSR